jgi:hypothetical protein
MRRLLLLPDPMTRGDSVTFFARVLADHGCVTRSARTRSQQRIADGSCEGMKCAVRLMVGAAVGRANGSSDLLETRRTDECTCTAADGARPHAKRSRRWLRCDKESTTISMEDAGRTHSPQLGTARSAQADSACNANGQRGVQLVRFEIRMRLQLYDCCDEQKAAYISAPSMLLSSSSSSSAPFGWSALPTAAVVTSPPDVSTA